MCCKISLEFPLLQPEQPQLSHLVLTGEVLQIPDHFCGSSLDSLQQVHVFPMLRTPELNAVLQVGQNPHPCPASHTAPDAAQDAVGILGCKQCTKEAENLNTGLLAVTLPFYN